MGSCLGKNLRAKVSFTTATRLELGVSCSVITLPRSRRVDGREVTRTDAHPRRRFGNPGQEFVLVSLVGVPFHADLTGPVLATHGAVAGVSYAEHPRNRGQVRLQLTVQAGKAFHGVCR